MKPWEKYKLPKVNLEQTITVNGYEIGFIKDELNRLCRQLGSINPMPAVYDIDDKPYIIIPEETSKYYTPEMMNFTINHLAYFHINDLQIRFLENLHKADVFAYHRTGYAPLIVREIFEASEKALDDLFGIFKWFFIHYDKKIISEREKLLVEYVKKQEERKAQ